MFGLKDMILKNAIAEALDGMLEETDEGAIDMSIQCQQPWKNIQRMSHHIHISDHILFWSMEYTVRLKVKINVCQCCYALTM